MVPLQTLESVSLQALGSFYALKRDKNDGNVGPISGRINNENLSPPRQVSKQVYDYHLMWKWKKLWKRVEIKRYYITCILIRQKPNQNHANA